VWSSIWHGRVLASKSWGTIELCNMSRTFQRSESSVVSTYVLFGMYRKTWYDWKLLDMSSVPGHHRGIGGGNELMFKILDIKVIKPGMDPAWSGKGGGSALPALVPSCVGHVCRPPINLLHYCKVLLDYYIWIVIVVHSSLIIMLLLKLLYLILSLITFCFITLPYSTHPLWSGLGGAPPPPPQ
jgi:hypothetical protein